MRDSILRKLIAVIIAVAFLFPVLSPKTFAASTITISGGESVKGGETFTVNVTYSGSDIGSVTGYMTYDTDKLTYLSGGSSSGNVGQIELKEIGDGTVSFKIKFQAVSEGSTKINITTHEMYDTGGNSLDRPSASKTVSISGNADSQQLITEERDSQTPVDSTIEAVDEKEDEKANGSMPTVILLVSAAIIAVIIGVIIAVLAKKKRR